MFKIGEFSKLTQVSIRMLRYYDATGILKPAIVDSQTGYRLYLADQIHILNKILFLRDAGFNISEMIHVLKNWDDGVIQKQLQMKEEETKRTIDMEQKRLRKIRGAMEDLKKQQISICCNVTLKEIPSYSVLSLRKIIPNYFHEEHLWEEICSYIEDEKLKSPQNNNGFAIYHDVEYKEKDVDVEVCIVTEQNIVNEGSFLFREIEAVPQMACFMVNGPYENIGPAYRTFASWLGDQSQYQMVGGSRQVCHKGPWNESDPEQYLTEIQIPIEVKRDK